MNARRAAAVVLLAAVLLALAPAIARLADLSRSQWDFRTYHAAARALDAGQDPYDTAELSRLSSAPILLPFVYPPTALIFFKLFAWLPYVPAAHLWLGLKAVAFVALIFLWSRAFIREPIGPLFVGFTLLAFNSAVYADLRSGNPGLFEQLLLWLGFFFYLKRKWAAFCAFVLAAAFIKIQPILLLGLLLISGDRKAVRYLAGSIGVFAGVFIAIAALRPELWSAFAANLFESNTDILLFENGRINPSGFAFIEHSFWLTQILWGVTLPLWARALLHELFIVGVLWAAFRTLARVRRQRPTVEVLFFALLTYAMLLPRFKDYSYALCIPPAYWAIRRLSGRGVLLALAFLCAAASATQPVAELSLTFRLLWEYFPFLITAALWVYYRHAIDRRPPHV